MRCRLLLVFAGWILALPGAVRAQRAPVLPVDEAARQPEFFIFRAHLQAAVARHDTAALLHVVAPDILNSFGGDGGRGEFREQWGLSTPNGMDVWAVLGGLLALGGRFTSDTTFYAPYTFKGTPGDGFETLAVTGHRVPVRAGPDSTAAAIDTVSFEAVTRWRGAGVDAARHAGWEPVRTDRGRTGWVPAGDVRSPIDYRAGFVRRGGRWWLRALVAGD